ncbi:MULTISPECIES: flagellar hook-basal body complex protein FliE [unclassified Iodidimonas]|jgi:flagellar hook-basal body complex protein FliE|uniref:flagellar hook-basal body complex protein FliE n=1 Tax=unclassified Iodidimonas TaxID=2626145 RepID=UPI002482C106|nr:MULTISPECIES: flagellar hook-basal body complex protein FliE [unclassified Iodidimonas]
MAITFLPVEHVAQAYNTAQSMGLDGPGAAFFTDQNGVSFEDFMKAGVETAINRVRGSEAVTEAALRGKASVQEVVQSVMAADMTVQSVIAVRDRLVSAYQEILRMPI